jgi:hypothetical protein
MSRGRYRWRFALPGQQQGTEQLIPALIRWETKTPAKSLADSGWRLTGLQAEHPDPRALHVTLAEHGVDAALTVRHSTEARLIARLRHADGREVSFTSR